MLQPHRDALQPGLPRLNYQGSSPSFSTEAVKDKFVASSQSAPPPPGSSTRIFIKLVGAGVGLAMFQLLIPAILFGYTFATYDGYFSFDDWTLATTAPLGRVTAIANFLDTVISLSVAPTMGFFAYVVAVKWLRASASNERSHMLTPVQYALQLNLFDAANIVALLRAQRFLSNTGKATRHFRANRVTIPRHLKQSTMLLFWLVTIRYAVSGVNTALQASAVAAPVATKEMPELDQAEMMLGRALNRSRCHEVQDDSDRWRRASCGLSNGSANEGFAFLPGSNTARTNTSSTHALAWLDEGSAIVVPPARPAARFEARSPSIASTCRSVTAQCLCQGVGDPVYPTTAETRCLTGPQSNLAIDCSSDARFNATAFLTLNQRGGSVNSYTAYPAAALLHANGSLVDDRALFAPTTNKFSIGAVITSLTYANHVGQEQWAGDTGFFVHGHQGAWNILQCDVEVSEVVYAYSPGDKYRLQSRSAAPLDLTTYLAYHADVGLDSVTIQVDGAGLGGSASYADSFSRVLSKSILAMASNIFLPEPAISISGGDQLGTVLDLRLVLAWTILAVLSSFSAVLVALLAAFSCLSAGPAHGSFASATAERLSDPLFLSNWLFGSRALNAKEEYSDNPLELFEPEHEGDRLVMGPHWDGCAWTLSPRRA
ncbi:hypothetical protein JCM10207_007540 [Rhodosporidiobolus poonsookiae]